MSSKCSDEDARRAYWTRMMDEAYDFMQKIPYVSVVECGESVASLTNAVEDAVVEVTFASHPHVDGCQRRYYLREGLVDDFLGVARAMNELGWVLHVEDAYRSRQMQQGLARQKHIFEVILKRTHWELDGETPDADLVYRRVAALIVVVPNVATHMSSSAIDVSVFQRGDRCELDRGSPYLELSELTPMDSPFVGPDAKQNRQQITGIFEQFGFVAYPFEFWHYSKGDAYDVFLHGRQEPARYGPIDVDPETGGIKPIENPTEPLNSLEDIQQMIRKTLDV